MAPKLSRILLKVSGEILGSLDGKEVLNPAYLEALAQSIAKIHQMGIQIGLVVGGGNIFRGQNALEQGISRSTGDYMGMLSTAFNGLAIMSALEKEGIEVRLQSAIPMDVIAEPFILRRAIRHLEKKRVVIFVAGTGHPYFSTDTTAALRAIEIHANLLLKATKVNGVYQEDPIKNPSAKRYEKISFAEVLEHRLMIMDSTAFSLCMDNDMPIYVFDSSDPQNIVKAVSGEQIGTLIS